MTTGRVARKAVLIVASLVKMALDRERGEAQMDEIH